MGFLVKILVFVFHCHENIFIINPYHHITSIVSRTCHSSNGLHYRLPDILLLGVAEKRYGIFTLGSKSIIGRILPRDTDITVFFDGKSYSAHTHKTSGGRIDRLSALLNLENIHVNTKLIYEYDDKKKELYVTLSE